MTPASYPITMPLLLSGGVAAVALPTWVTWSAPPVFSVASQATALIGWGLFVIALACTTPAAAEGRPQVTFCLRQSRGLLAILAIFALLIAASAASVWRGAPGTLAFARIGLLLAAAIVLWCGWHTARSTGAAANIGGAFLWSVLVAGVINAAFGVIQFTAPHWADEFFIAGLREDLRPAGNLRQPNFLATQLVWAITAAAGLREMRRLHLGAFIVIVFGLLHVVVLTGSRIGLLSCGALALWALADRRLSTTTRSTLASMPLWLLLNRLAIDAWSVGSGGVRTLDVESSRYALWLDALQMIRAEPWWGVGVGEFNYAWTLTPSPRRAQETFTHTHNLVLQWAVEIGLPLTIVLIALLCLALHRAIIAAWTASGDDGVLRRSSVVLIGAMLLHSQTEFPLWYAYFLLPTAFAVGLALAPQSSGKTAPPEPSSAGKGQRTPHLVLKSRTLAIGGIILVAGGVAVLHDYRKVAAVYEPASDAELTLRIAEGRKSLLFGQHADRFAGTLLPAGSRRLEPYRRVVHEMLDVRLLIAWSQALAENGQVERARFVAARVAEFNDPATQRFFAACDHMEATHRLPFQCTPPARQFEYRDFR